MHTFNIGPFTTADIYTNTPTIDSPSNGSILPNGFLLSWHWPVGTTPPVSYVIHALHISGHAPLTFNPHSSSSRLVTATFPSGVSEASYKLGVGTLHSLNNQVSPVTTSPASPRYRLLTSLSYFSLSAPVNVTIVVPEPSTAIVFCGICAFAAVARRRL